MYKSEIGHFSLSVPRATVLALILLRVSCAGEAVFGKSALVEPGRRKAVPVELIVSDAGVTIREKATASTILELSYTAITKLGYSYMDFRRPSLTPLIGAAALFATGKSHWLVVESAAGSGRQTTILRLDKSEYLNAIALLGAKSGKPVEMLAPGSTLLDPTAGSHDQDETVPFPPEQVLAPVKSAMELYSQGG